VAQGLDSSNIKHEEAMDHRYMGHRYVLDKQLYVKMLNAL
jgi:hypothetical protein